MSVSKSLASFALASVEGRKLTRVYWVSWAGKNLVVTYNMPAGRGWFRMMFTTKSMHNPRWRRPWRSPKLKWTRIMGWSILFLFLMLIGTARASDFEKLDEAIPGGFVSDLAPVFDFDTDSCLPSTGISRSGEQNGGLSPTGSITGQCRSSNFLDTSNTLHRYACTSQNGSTYCGHFYALYFEKDQATIFGFGHRHDWEHVAIWTKDGVITHGSASAHGELDTRAAADLPFENGHLKVVYHLSPFNTHSLRFAKTNESAENPYGKFVTPTLISWYNLTGDGLDNATMRAKLNGFDYGDAVVPVKDGKFWGDLNNNRPPDYPYFPAQNISLNDSPDPVRVGELLEYTTAIVNNGPDVPQAKVEFVLADGLIFVDGTDGCLETSESIISCDLGMILADETKTIVVNTQVTQGAASTIVTSAKAIIEAGDDTNPDNIIIVDDETTSVIRVIYLPLIGNNVSPDLVVEKVEFVGGNVLVTIINQGTNPTSVPFWVDLYVDPNPVPTGVNQIWEDGRSEFGLVWGVTTPLAPGDTLSLSIGDPYYWEILSNFPESLPAGTPVYVQVDSANTETTYGGVLELHEIIGTAYNNIIGPMYPAAGGSLLVPAPDTADKTENTVDQLPLRPR